MTRMHLSSNRLSLYAMFEAGEILFEAWVMMGEILFEEWLTMYQIVVSTLEAERGGGFGKLSQGAKWQEVCKTYDVYEQGQIIV
jgi:hypothetical protein